MEFPLMGQKCETEHCKQLDFLPLQCQCGKVFCSKHLHDHLPQCSESKNVTLTEDELRKIENIFVCSKSGCKLRSVVPLICERCQKHFCIQHRHLTECEPKTEQELAAAKEKYAEPVRQFQQAKAAVDIQVENSLNEARKKSKNREMANKVQLMRIKNKATGQKSIPSTDRVYFNVLYHEAKGTEKTISVFVSKTWSLGRAIDAVASECKLQNNNHKSNEKKLRLFKKCDNEILATNLTVTLQKLIETKMLFDGEDLIISYVDDDCVRL